MKLLYPTQPPVEDASIGGPGEFPYTRGIHPGMYRDRLWTMRQYAGFGNARQSNERYRYLISRGTTGLSVAFDLPTQMGYDSDHSLALGEVGRAGVAISSIADIEQLFKGIALDKVSTSMTINSTAAILLALYVAVGRQQGVEGERFRALFRTTFSRNILLAELISTRRAHRCESSPISSLGRRPRRRAGM